MWLLPLPRACVRWTLPGSLISLPPRWLFTSATCLKRPRPTVRRTSWPSFFPCPWPRCPLHSNGDVSGLNRLPFSFRSTLSMWPANGPAREMPHMWDFSIGRALGLMKSTLSFIIFRCAVYFGIALAYVLVTGAGAGVGWGIGGLGDEGFQMSATFWGGTIGFGVTAGVIYFLR